MGNQKLIDAFRATKQQLLQYKGGSMRKHIVVLSLFFAVVMLSIPVVASSYEGCCYNTKANHHYAAGSITMAGPLDVNGCVVGDTWATGDCPADTVPTAIPTVPQPYEPPKTIEIPGWLTWILGMFAPKYVVPFAALLSAVLIPVTQVMKQLLASFGAKLSGKVVYCITAFITFLIEVTGTISDGTIQGAEWITLVVSLIAFVVAPFGYKVLFSNAAKAKLENKLNG